MIVLVSFLLAILTVVHSDEIETETYHCSKHLFPSNKGPYSPMELSKEASTEEFAIVGKFKGLHCCARNYRSIIWLKDGKPYPWSYESVSRMILYPASANQTIYAHQVYPEDAGNYTCVLTNDTTVFSHTIQLHVYEKPPDEPKVTFLSDDAEVEVGNPVRLFCEAFVGQVDLPDAHNEAKWMRLDKNETSVEVEEDRVQHEAISREDNQTFGSYLTIDQVKDEDFGNYICRISNVGGEKLIKIVQIKQKVPVVYLELNPIPWNKLLTITLVIAVVLFVIMVLYIRHGLQVRVHLKDRFGNEENAQEARNKDALVVYSESDSELTLGVLLPTLENFGYSCTSKELKPDNYSSWNALITDPAQRCKRIIVVLSPGLTGLSNWDAANLKSAVKQILNAGLPVICVTLKEMPKASQIKDAQGESLDSILKQTSVVPWLYRETAANDKNFWLSLRLRMPPKNSFNYNETRQSSENNMMVDLRTQPTAKKTEDFHDIMV